MEAKESDADMTVVKTLMLFPFVHDRMDIVSRAETLYLLLYLKHCIVCFLFVLESESDLFVTYYSLPG